jgi:phosphohistidine phosphatase
LPIETSRRTDYGSTIPGVRLYFLRHGIAASREEAGGEDARRPLTDRGRHRIGEVAAFLAERVVEIDLVLASPLLRCVQTAELVVAALEMPDRLLTDPRLAPGFGPARLAGIVREHSDANGIVLVGHEPDFSETVGYLIGGGRVVCRKGSVACVEVPDTSTMEGELEWLVSPAIIPG